MKALTRKFFIAKTHNTYIQLMRYCFAGGLSFIVDFCILFALTDFLHINYLASAPVAFVFGLITKYIVSICWVFHRRVFTNSWVQFSIFAFIGLVGLILN